MHYWFFHCLFISSLFNKSYQISTLLLIILRLVISLSKYKIKIKLHPKANPKIVMIICWLNFVFCQRIFFKIFSTILVRNSFNFSTILVRNSFNFLIVFLTSLSVSMVGILLSPLSGLLYLCSFLRR